MLIREVVSEDLINLADMEQVCFISPWSYELLKSAFENPQCKFFLIENANEVVGYAGFVYAKEMADIMSIAVMPDYRRKGLAKMLLLHLISELEKLGVQQVLLEVRATNVAAQNLYYSLGFRYIGIRKGYYTDTGEDAHVLKKIL